MKLRNRTSYMKTLPEGEPPPRRGPSITRRLYMLLLLGLLAYLAYIAFDRLFFVHGWGQVEVEKITISSARGGRIEALNMTEGQQVDEGELLARVGAPKRCHPEQDPRLQRLLMDAELTRSRLAVLAGELQRKRAEAAQYTRLRRALEVDTRNSREARELTDAVEQLQQDVTIHARRLEIERDQAETLRAELAARPLPLECLDEELRAPHPATVLHVGNTAAEVVERGETIATLVPRDAGVRVEAYLETDDLEDVQVGKPMQVEFPDGYVSAGVIESVQSSAYRSAERRWDGYTPLSSRVLVRLVPTEAEQRQRWAAYDRMDVRVRAVQ